MSFHLFFLLDAGLAFFRRRFGTAVLIDFPSAFYICILFLLLEQAKRPGGGIRLPGGGCERHQCADPASPIIRANPGSGGCCLAKSFTKSVGFKE